MSQPHLRQDPCAQRPENADVMHIFGRFRSQRPGIRDDKHGKVHRVLLKVPFLHRRLLVEVPTQSDPLGLIYKNNKDKAIPIKGESLSLFYCGLAEFRKLRLRITDAFEYYKRFVNFGF